MRKKLSVNFFDRPTTAVARDLLGKHLVRRWQGKELALLITEVEAYDGPHDRASHASRGKTRRTRIMFGPAGRFYVYFTYGMHWLVNIVTGPKEYPAAVLIRAGGYHNDKTGTWTELNGPARLTKFLHIGKAQNGKIARPESGLWFEDRGAIVPKKIVASKRIGVDYAGPIWKNKPYRFSIIKNRPRTKAKPQ